MRDQTIVIAGKRWHVPMLAPRQNRVIVPSLMRFGARPEERYDALLDIVFAALARAHPDIAREDFDDWPVATHELLDALPVIAKQTGLLRAAQRRRPHPELVEGHPEPVEGHPESVEGPDWDSIIAQFVNFLPGTTPDYWEDALTIPRLEAMREEWRINPPPSRLLAAWLGYRPRPRDEDALAELLRLFPAGALRLN